MTTPLPTHLPTLALEIDIEEPWPAHTNWEAMALRGARAIAALVPELAHPALSASVLFTSDAQVHALNREWREKDKPTNVLSFPMLEREDLLAFIADDPDADGPPEMLGDIALAYETCAREAEDKGLSLADHATHLLIHGLLHLAGHDHEISPADARVMEELEIKALALIGIADPYGDHEA